MRFLILTLFPEMFTGPLSESILQKAQDKKLLEISLKNIREFGIGKHRQVDDVPYGGGAGMVMRADVLAKALRWAKEELPEAKVVFLSPLGERLTQKKCRQLAEDQVPLILLCGHYEGVDERVREMFADEEISLGDFVLTGGEIPAMALIDSVARLLPGVVGNEESTEEESFSPQIGGRMEYPHYTRPETFENMKVPEVLLSGHHAEIEKWRMDHLQGFSEEEFRIFRIRKEYFSPQKPWKSAVVLLRGHEESDIELWLKWWNDEEVTRYLRFNPPYTREDAEEDLLRKQEDFRGIFVTVLDRTSKKVIGNASLELSEDSDYAAELAVCIGEKECWGKGVGTAVVLEMIEIGFEMLQLEKIFLDVFQENSGAVQMYQKCGFQVTGEIRKGVRKPDGFHDLFHMELLRQTNQQQHQEEDHEVTKKYLEFRGNFEV